jgi:hypothetical protein
METSSEGEHLSSKSDGEDEGNLCFICGKTKCLIILPVSHMFSSCLKLCAHEHIGTQCMCNGSDMSKHDNTVLIYT